MRRRRWLGLGLLVAAALLFRLAVVASFHASAGDGIQYYQLAHELRLHGRFAFGPPPSPLTFARLPGYPLFLAFLANPTLPRTLEQHLRWATAANALLDVGTALLVLAMVRRLATGIWAAVVGFGLVILCPLLLYLSMYGLCESLTTFLLTVELYALLRAAEAGQGRFALLAGGAAGLAQLVRVDSLALWPVALLLLLTAAVPWPKRLRSVGLYAVALGLLVAPWPLRNLAQFGEAHVGGVPWAAQSGKPLPFGMQRWFLSWSAGAPGQAYVLLPVAWERPLDASRSGILQPAMYDDEAERQQVATLFARYNRLGLAPEVDAAFAALAAQRLARRPLRTLVGLPLLRMQALWQPMPEYELPVRSSLLRLPAWRPRLALLQRGVLCLGLLGGLWLLRRPGPARRLALAVLLTLLGRTVLFAYVHPFPVERYLVEGYPGLLGLAAVALEGGPRWLVGRRRRFAQKTKLHARVSATVW